MLNKYKTIIIAGLAISFMACKKANNDTPVIGRWQQNKLRLYIDSGGIIIHDTTYLHPFTNSDYIQFNTNGTCTLSASHYYYPNLQGYPKTPQQITPNVSGFTYEATGAKYVLNTQSMLISPGGFVVGDTISMPAANTLLFRSVSYGHIGNYETISDSYYTQ
jgi:hypothetical protein